MAQDADSNAATPPTVSGCHCVVCVTSNANLRQSTIIKTLTANAERVRELHCDDHGICPECSDKRTVSYPCQTRRAIDGDLPYRHDPTEKGSPP
jgi:hypothetical protein